MSWEIASTPRLWADFNELEGDVIEADLEFAASFTEDKLAPGSRALLFDGGGHEVVGEIVAVDLEERLVRLRVDWNTWESPMKHLQLEREFRGRPHLRSGIHQQTDAVITPVT
jgi:hypothetical protein